MLASAPAGQLDKWVAFYRLEPFGNPWLVMSAGVTAIINIFRLLVNSFSERPLKEEDVVLDRDAFVLRFEDDDVEAKQPPPKTVLDTAALRKQFEARWRR